jgi:hypothetical protein
MSMCGRRSVTDCCGQVILVVALLCTNVLPTSKSVGDDSAQPPELRDAGSARDIKTLVLRAREAAYNSRATRVRLWHAADAVCSSPSSSSTAIAGAVQLACYATLLERVAGNENVVWPADEDQFTLGSAALRALQDFSGYPANGDGNIRLFERKPRIEMRSLNGLYRQYRFDFHRDSVSMIYEWTDIPVAGLTQAKTETKVLLPAGQPIPDPAISGHFTSFPLAALNEVIAAGQICLFRELISDKECQQCAESIVSSLFLKAASPQPSFGLIAAGLLKSTIDSYKSTMSPEVLAGTQLRYAASFFYAGRMHAALTEYERAVTPENNPELSTSRLWGIAVCRLATRQPDRGVAWKQVYSQLSTKIANTDIRRQVLASLCRVLPPSEFGCAVAECEWYSQLREKPSVQSASERYSVTVSTRSLLLQIGRWEDCVELLLEELQFARNMGDKGAEHERSYVQSLLVIMGNEAFNTISWSKNAANGLWSPRLADNGVVHADAFAPYYTGGDDPRVKGTQIKRYGILAPSEDLATCVELYGVSPDAMPDGLRTRVSEKVAAAVEREIGVGVKKWVTDELARTPPNLQPLLKLIWLEWFFVPSFDFPQNDDSAGLRGWVYRPSAVTGMTSPAAIESLFSGTDEGKMSAERQVYRVFAKVRKSLEAKYTRER